MLGFGWTGGVSIGPVGVLGVEDCVEPGVEPGVDVEAGGVGCGFDVGEGPGGSGSAAAEAAAAAVTVRVMARMARMARICAMQRRAAAGSVLAGRGRGGGWRVIVRLRRCL
ncbi:hypothetical protein GCM10022419_121530 [Nonomuraea rosea]|uniref:Uncharacterized protein n=1 Tax=Nonomuraea rosea TaxID=638574 RepID=A0ABP6ZSE1_9ACTN